MPVPPATFLQTLLSRIAASTPSIGPSFAQAAADRGLAVTRADGSQRPIPIGALPVIVTDEEIAARAALAAQLVSATAKAARWRMSGAHRHAVMGALGPAEQRLVDATWDTRNEVAVARVDFLGSSQLQALEVNTTIPAMQGYSDIAAESWIRAFAPAHANLAAIIGANGSNTQALLHALRDLFARQRHEALSSLGLLCRRGDAQITELNFIRDRFREAGVDARIVHPDELVLRNGYLQHSGVPLQLVYRHLFVSRLDDTPAPDVEAAMIAPAGKGTLVLNRPTPHLEMKSTLGVLSEAIEDPALAQAIGLLPDEQDAIRVSVPWTRSIGAPDGPPDAVGRELMADVVANPGNYVLKRSWSYGGNEVFVGRAHESADFWKRVHATYPDIDRWSELCERAARDTRGGGFVVQRAISTQRTEQFLCTPTSVHRDHVTTDYAAYASLGTAPAWSGVCRAAPSDIVNIVGGGAVVPLIRRRVAEQLFPRMADEAIATLR